MFRRWSTRVVSFTIATDDVIVTMPPPLAEAIATLAAAFESSRSKLACVPSSSPAASLWNSARP